MNHCVEKCTMMYMYIGKDQPGGPPRPVQCFALPEHPIATMTDPMPSLRCSFLFRYM